MLQTAIKQVRQLPKVIKTSWIQRRRKKLAQIAEIEETEREALVTELARKFAAAHVDCEEKKKTSATIECSSKEIIFIEGYLESWNRHFRERAIYRLRPASNVQPSHRLETGQVRILGFWQRAVRATDLEGKRHEFVAWMRSRICKLT